MKLVCGIILSLIIFSRCNVNKIAIAIENKPGENDSIQYELIIDEPGFESWMIGNSKPIWYHQKEYYHGWNILYTREFNHRVLHSFPDHPFTETIDYDPQTDYGPELEYKLFWYFKYIEHKYNTKLHITSR